MTRAKRLARSPKPTCDKSWTRPAGRRNFMSGSEQQMTLSPVFWTRPKALWTKRSLLGVGDAYQYKRASGLWTSKREAEKGLTWSRCSTARKERSLVHQYFRRLRSVHKEGEATHDGVDTLGLELVVRGNVGGHVILRAGLRKGCRARPRSAY